MLSVYPLARMRARSHDQRVPLRSKASSPSSDSAERNWIAKNRIAARLVTDQFSKGVRSAVGTVERLGNEIAHVFAT